MSVSVTLERGHAILGVVATVCHACARATEFAERLRTLCEEFGKIGSRKCKPCFRCDFHSVGYRLQLVGLFDCRSFACKALSDSTLSKNA